MIRFTARSDGADTQVAVLPFLSQRYAVRAAEIVANTPSENVRAYDEQVRQVIGSLTGGFGGDTVNLVMSHITCVGGTFGGGERSAQSIFEYSVPASVFPVSAHYVALGHLHRRQALPAPAPVHYSGAPLAVDFGEQDNTSVVCLVEAAPGSRPGSPTSPSRPGGGCAPCTARSPSLRRGPATSATTTCGCTCGSRPAPGCATTRSRSCPTPSRCASTRSSRPSRTRPPGRRGPHRADPRAAVRRLLRHAGTSATRGSRPCSVSCTTRSPPPTAPKLSAGRLTREGNTMRPIMLDLHGFASFRDEAHVDFGDADFFALVGPTGSGKSTVIDAMTFALYGSVPRWGRKGMVSLALAPTVARGTVKLVFEVDRPALRRGPRTAPRRRHGQPARRQPGTARRPARPCPAGRPDLPAWPRTSTGSTRPSRSCSA